MSKIVVFGAGGFIGQHLVRSLAAKSDDEIVAFDRFSKYQAGAENPFAEINNVSIVVGDFFNRADVASVLNNANYVFHLVSSTNPAASNDNPFIDIDTDVRSTIELLQLCVEKGVKKVIFPSSGGTVYGDTDSDKIDELTVPTPRSPYGIGKLTIEHYLRYFKFKFGLDYIVYRVANPYGPGQNIFGKQGVIPIFMHKFLVGEPVTVYGDGSMVRDYVFVDDLIRMIVLSYSRDNQFSEYNLGSGSGTSVNDVLRHMEQCTGQSVSREHLAVPATFVQKSVLDISRFETEFGKQSFTDMDEGMRKTWGYVKQLG